MSGRYKMLESLGVGGAGAVFKAYDTQLDRYVAIKRLLTRQEAEQEDSQSSSLRKEAGSLATLQHPNIVSIYDLGSDEEGMFIVMELLEGETLADLIAASPLNLQDFFELASQTLEGTLYAHSMSILHRDLKPENIKVKRQPGGRLQVKIVDFGLARLSYGARKQTEDQSGNVLGSIFYMAPEQFLRKPLDGRTDLYSLGCVYYQALSGLRPFENETMAGVMDMHLQHQVTLLHDVCPHLPERVCDWVMWLFNREPNDRPGNAQFALESLRSFRDQGLFSDAPAVLPEAAPATPSTSNVGRASGALTAQRPVAPVPVRPSVPTSTLMADQVQSEGIPVQARKGNPKWIYVATGIVLAGAALFFWMLTGHGRNSGQAGARSNGVLAPGVIIHWRAGEKMDAWAEPGKPAPSVQPNDLVSKWHNFARDAQDATLNLFQNKKEQCPKYIVEKPDGFKTSLGIMRFQAGNGMQHYMDLQKAEAANYPFSEKSRPRGLTLMMLVRVKIGDKEMRILRLHNQSNKASLEIRAFPGNEFRLITKVNDKSSTVSVTRMNPGQFNIISVVWNDAASNLLFSVRGQDGQKGGPSETPAPIGCPMLNGIRFGEIADKKESFTGDLAELLLWPFPLEAGARALQEQKLCEQYFVNPGQKS